MSSPNSPGKCKKCRGECCKGYFDYIQQDRDKDRKHSSLGPSTEVQARLVFTDRDRDRDRALSSSSSSVERIRVEIEEPEMSDLPQRLDEREGETDTENMTEL